MKTKKIKKIPKALAGALIGTGVSLISGLLNNSKAEREQEIAQQRALTLARSNAAAEDSIRLADYKEEGNGIIDYYGAYGGTINPDKEKKQRPANEEEAERDAKTSQFTKEGIMALGFVNIPNNTKKPSINYGKYKGLNYFEEDINGNSVTLKPSKDNIRNADNYKESFNYLRKLNPNVSLVNGYVPTNMRKENGGKITAPSYASIGGELKPLSSDMELIKGQTHAEGGVDLLDNNGKAFVEVEDDETIKDGTKVYSDKLKFINNKTYADNAEILAKKKGKIEENMSKGDSITRFTNKRKLASLDNEEDLLFEHQEMSKLKSNKKIDKAEEGGQLNKILNTAAPFLDNITNAFLTSKTPKLAEPIIQRQVPLKTKINVQPQLNAVTDAVEASANNIKNNTSNSAVARNEITSARLQGSRQKAAINANKENVEAQMYNANVRNTQNVTANNLAKLDNYNQANVMRTNDIQKRISDNVANFADDIIDKRNFDAAEKYNKERLDIASNMYQQDTTRRALLSNPSEIMYLKSNPDYANQVLEKFKGTREEEELRKLLGIPLVSTVSKLSPSGYANIN